MLSIIDEMTYAYKKQLGVFPKNIFVPLVPYANKHSVHQIDNFNKDIAVKSHIGEYINGVTDIEELSKYVSDGFDFLNNTFGLESMKVMPICFDHKIANEFGSFPRFYPLVTKQPVSRDQINLLEQDLNG